MNIDRITKTQLIRKLVEQHRKIQSLENRSSDSGEKAPRHIIDSSESLLRTNSVGIITINKKGIITSCNDALLEFSGYKRQDLLGKYFTRKVSISTKDMHRYASVFRDILAGRESEPFQIMHELKDGTRKYGEVFFGPLVNRDLDIAGFKIVIRDITRQKQLEEKFNGPDDKIESFMESSLDGIAIHDNGAIVRANRAFAEIFNPGNGSLQGKHILEFISEDHRQRFASRIEEEDVQPVEIIGTKSTGSRVYLETSGDKITYNGSSLRMDIFHDISELRRAEKKIKYLKFHDSLTELYNRTYLEKVLGNVYRERSLPLNFIICDLNGLKLVNDAFGYREGDKLLKRVARILKYCARKEDIVARWGGDEFFILLPRSTASEVEDVVYKIRSICTNTRDQKIPLNISIGIATRADSSQDYREVIKEAEDNLYTNKLFERKSVYNSILASLERMLWEKSHETKEHAERLKGLIVRLGKSINLPQNKLDELVLLSTLHDIGKVAVPDSILLKKGILNDEEWKIIRRHPEIGYNIAKSTPQIAIVADDILAHHEWWDGSGYPQGLKEDDIPINSCITSIVDAYDVMISGRPYKEPISAEAAREELKRCSGIQFNPLLVDRFINCC
jgi:diguanylate cyclase (GGDEF)-like protein/PAS domain S-box-containing protein